MVVEQDGAGERSFDIFSRLMKDRIIVLNGEVDEHMSAIVTAQLLVLDNDGSEKDIDVYINSPGGSVTAGMAIYDVMQMCTCNIRTICMGQAASMGAMLLSAGTKGKRVALRSARIMIHQPSGGAYGTTTDMEIQVEEIVRLKAMLNGYMAENCGKTIEEIIAATERDHFMSADDAVKFGIIDAVWRKK